MSSILDDFLEYKFTSSDSEQAAKYEIKKISNLLNINSEYLCNVDPIYINLLEFNNSKELRDEIENIYFFNNRIPKIIDAAYFLNKDSKLKKEFIEDALVVWYNKENDVKYITYLDENKYTSTFIDIRSLDKFDKHVRNRHAIYYNLLNIEPIYDNDLWDSIYNHTIGFIANHEEYKKLGIKLSKGILLYGPAGNGKSLLVHTLVGECIKNNIKYRYINTADLLHSHKNSSLEKALSSKGITIFDDIDIQLLTNRDKSGTGMVSNDMLSAMDKGASYDYPVVRIFTTNIEQLDLDTAFTRPGRIDVKIELKAPTDELREKLIRKNWRKFDPQDLFIEDKVIDNLIYDTKDFSFAELESLRSYIVINKDIDKGFEDYEKYVKVSMREKKKKVSGFGS